VSNRFGRRREIPAVRRALRALPSEAASQVTRNDQMCQPSVAALPPREAGRHPARRVVVVLAGASDGAGAGRRDPGLTSEEGWLSPRPVWPAERTRHVAVAGDGIPPRTVRPGREADSDSDVGNRGGPMAVVHDPDAAVPGHQVGTIVLPRQPEGLAEPPWASAQVAVSNRVLLTAGSSWLFSVTASANAKVTAPRNPPQAIASL